MKKYYKAEEVKKLIESIIRQSFKWGWDSAHHFFDSKGHEIPYEFIPPRRMDEQTNMNVFAAIVREAKERSREIIDFKRVHKTMILGTKTKEVRQN